MRLSAVRVFVNDLAPAKSFYAGVLGLRLTHDGSQHGYCTFESGGIHVVVETLAPEASAEDRALVGRFAGISFAVEDIGAEYDRLRKAGVEFTGAPEKQSWGGTLATFRDPSGNELQIAQYGA